MSEKATKLIEEIRGGVIGEGRLFQTPFGIKPLIYADYTASGRALTFIEDYMRENILPFYANTHSESSATGRQTTAFREQARTLIKKSLKAGDEHALIFCGSGATAAIQKMIDILNIRIPANLDDVHGFSAQIKAQDRPVLFIGPYEHHSNELAWRESIVDLVSIPLSDSGAIDRDILQQELDNYADRKLKIGSFSAASNVTGLLSDVQAVTRLLHENGALAFWDYAAAGPYVEIDVNRDEIDALYISPHKFIGGPGTAGVLAVRRTLLTNRVPSVPGGGTVSYVSPEGHSYLDDAETREEGGTPAIVESIRAGLVFQLKDAVGAKNIEQREDDMVRRAIRRWSKNPNIQILGDRQAPRTSIISFLISHQGKPLHFGLIDALINDLFGIQVRGGCSCAGPYGHELLHIDMEHSKAITDAVEAGHLVLKPGWVRLNFNYFIGEETFEYLLRAVELIAEHGWKMLDKYVYDAGHGVWKCQDAEQVACRRLDDISYKDGRLKTLQYETHGERESLTRYSDRAEAFLKTASAPNPDAASPIPLLPDEFAALRWFLLPCDLAPNQDHKKSLLSSAKAMLTSAFQSSRS